MSLDKNKTRGRVALALLIIGAALVLCGLKGLLGDKYTEIDVMSGRTRTRVVMLGIVVAESEAETRFSQAVERNQMKMGPAEYRFAYGTTVGLQKLFGDPRISGAYGDALAMLDSMMVLFDLRPELLDDEQSILAGLLELLQAGDSQGIHDYVNGLDYGEPNAITAEDERG